MHTMPSTLPVGFYDWEPQHLPREEYEARIAALWERIGDPEIDGIVVYGNLRHHSELTWLANFMPKLDTGFLMLTRNGPPVLLGAQSPNHLRAAKPLTWIEDVRTWQNPGRTIREHLRGKDGAGKNRPLTIGMVAGDFLRTALHGELIEAMTADGQEPRLVDVAGETAALMRVKRPREIDALERALTGVDAACAAFAKVTQDGGNAWQAVSAGERAAWQHGARDVRALASLDGGRSYRPLVTPPADEAAAQAGYFAVRQSGYWAEGFIAPGAADTEASRCAAAALEAMMTACRPGVRADELAAIARAALSPCTPHGLNKADFGAGIGVALEESPRLVPDDRSMIEEGEVLALRVGASRGDQHAMRSAMVRIGSNGAEKLTGQE